MHVSVICASLPVTDDGEAQYEEEDVKAVRSFESSRGTKFATQHNNPQDVKPQLRCLETWYPLSRMCQPAHCAGRLFLVRVVPVHVATLHCTWLTNALFWKRLSCLVLMQS
jgi:hypothetical protein